MQLVLFSKAFKASSLAQMVEIAGRANADGYDLCIRDGHPITPNNVESEFKTWVDGFRNNGLSVPMASTEPLLSNPEDETVRPILGAVAEAGVPNLKIGYFVYKPDDVSYRALLNEARFKLDRWQQLSREFGVRICYHTHCGPCLGMNAAGLEIMLRGFDPACVGAYIDPAHLVVNGEDFDIALAMLKPHLAMVALKDVMLRREEKNGHGQVNPEWVQAGHGMVDWTLVFDRLKRINFDGPCSIHCEFETAPDLFEQLVVAETNFFKGQI